METGNYGIALMFLVCALLLYIPLYRDAIRRLRKLTKEQKEEKNDER